MKIVSKLCSSILIVEEEYRPEADAPTRDKVDAWLDELRDDAEFNVSAYVDSFLSENLVRKYLNQKQAALKPNLIDKATQFRDAEDKRKGEANISFSIRKTTNDLSYLGMDDLAYSVEGNKGASKSQSLWSDAISYAPVRNVVGIPAFLRPTAKLTLHSDTKILKPELESSFPEMMRVSLKPHNP